MCSVLLSYSWNAPQFSWLVAGFPVLYQYVEWREAESTRLSSVLRASFCRTVTNLELVSPVSRPRSRVGGKTADQHDHDDEVIGDIWRRAGADADDNGEYPNQRSK